MTEKKNKPIWINFLHCYQPANADDNRIKEATQESYLRIIRGLEEHSHLKFTMNISGCLVLRWQELGMDDIIKRIKILIDKKQIEITGSCAYHIFLPLMPEKENIKQIKENELILKKAFGVTKKDLKGFFLPEMAYNSKIAKTVKKLGYQWTILDEIAKKDASINNAKNIFYQDVDSDLQVIFRSRKYSNCYVPENFNNLDNLLNQNIITATDAELYGLRHQDPTAKFEKILKKVQAKNIICKTISEVLREQKNSKKIQKIKLISCNWESTKKELQNKLPFAQWYNPKNKIQMALWDFVKFTYKTVEANQKDANYKWSRWHLNRGMASCIFWWASEKDFSHIFGPFAWNPDEIERGLHELIRAIRSLHSLENKQAKIKAEIKYAEIKKMIWVKHWKSH